MTRAPMTLGDAQVTGSGRLATRGTRGIIHAVVARTPYRKPLDFWMHFSGGMAIAYFWFHALACFARWLGTPTPAGRYLFSFALACTVGLFWEFAELASDAFLATRA